jgi:hypothetical protein
LGQGRTLKDEVSLGDGLLLAEISDSSLLEQVYKLRVVAWDGKIKVPLSRTGWVDPEDGSARHWAIMSGRHVVAAARFSVHQTVAELPDAEGYVGVFTELPVPIGSLNRCVVHPDFRNRGLSRVLDRTRISAGKGSGCRCLVICATDEQRAAAIARLGFEFRGEGPLMPTGLAAGTRSLVYTLLF